MEIVEVSRENPHKRVVDIVREVKVPADNLRAVIERPIEGAEDFTEILVQVIPSIAELRLLSREVNEALLRASEENTKVASVGRLYPNC